MNSGSEKPDAYSLALARLTVREYSTREMKTYLKKKGIPPAEAEDAVSRLAKEGSLSDERYTLAVLRSQAARGKGPAYIRQKLQQKGVNLSLKAVEALFRDHLPEDETTAIRKLIQRRYPRAAEDPRELRRAWAALMRRGYSASAIGRVLRELPADD